MPINNPEPLHHAMKYISLAVLVFQNSALALFMRYSRTRAQGASYAPTTAVVMSELIKLLLSTTLVWKENESFSGCFGEIRDSTIHNPADFAKMIVPSFLYTIQNWLAYIATTNLNASTFQLLYQTKIVTTALFSVCMLKKILSKQQWSSLFLLVIGVVFVQSATKEDHGENVVEQQQGNAIIGLLAVSLASLSSGFAGVYFEKVLKGTKSSIWIRNIQLSSIGVIIACANMLLNDEVSVSQNGFFYGYNWTVWMAIFLNAGGGLLVAVVVKYADNILKGFATSLSIIVSVIVSYFILSDILLSFSFVNGALMIMSATVLYAVKCEDCKHHLNRVQSSRILYKQVSKGHEEDEQLQANEINEMNC